LLVFKLFILVVLLITSRFNDISRKEPGVVAPVTVRLMPIARVSDDEGYLFWMSVIITVCHSVHSRY
jgi:hypothetical protein